MDKEVYEIVQFFKNDVCQLEVRPDGEIWCWVWYFNLEKLSKLINIYHVNDSGIDAKLQGDTVFFVANSILDFYEIDHEIFTN